MRYVAAYLLAVLGGNENPSADDIKKILGSVGIEADAACLKKVISELSGKNIDDLIAEGRQKMSSMPAGAAVFSGASAISTSSSAAAAAGTEAASEEKKAEPKKEESEPESDEDMGFGLFD